MNEFEFIWRLIESGGLPGVIGLAVLWAVKDRSRQSGKSVATPEEVLLAKLSELASEMARFREDTRDRLTRLETNMDNLRDRR